MEFITFNHILGLELFKHDCGFCINVEEDKKYDYDLCINVEENKKYDSDFCIDVEENKKIVINIYCIFIDINNDSIEPNYKTFLMHVMKLKRKHLNNLYLSNLV